MYKFWSYCDVCQFDSHVYSSVSLSMAVFIIYAHLIFCCLCILTFYSNIIGMPLVYFIRIFFVCMFYIQWFCNLLDLLNTK